MELFAAMLSVAILVVISLYCARRKRLEAAGCYASCIGAMHILIDLLQALQKHRGLGGDPGADAGQKRLPLAREIDRLWSAWIPSVMGSIGLVAHWSSVKAAPADFAAHCKLIDQVLRVIALIEARAVRSMPKATLDISASCYAIEDMARLRGLAVRAAASPSCPLDLQIQIRYLCQRIGADNSVKATQIHEVLNRLREKLLDSAVSSLSPAECFDLITPLIDAKLNQLRSKVAAPLPRIIANFAAGR